MGYSDGRSQIRLSKTAQTLSDALGRREPSRLRRINGGLVPACSAAHRCRSIVGMAGAALEWIAEMRPGLHHAFEGSITVAGFDGDDLEQRRDHDWREGEQAKDHEQQARGAWGCHGSIADQGERHPGHSRRWNSNGCDGDRNDQGSCEISEHRKLLLKWSYRSRSLPVIATRIAL